MSLTPFEDLLALAEPPIANEAVQAAEKDLVEAKDHICYARFTSPLYYLPYPGIELPTSLR